MNKKKLTNTELTNNWCERLNKQFKHIPGFDATLLAKSANTYFDGLLSDVLAACVENKCFNLTYPCCVHEDDIKDNDNFYADPYIDIENPWKIATLQDTEKALIKWLHLEWGKNKNTRLMFNTKSDFDDPCILTTVSTLTTKQGAAFEKQALEYEKEMEELEEEEEETKTQTKDMIEILIDKLSDYGYSAVYKLLQSMNYSNIAK